MRIIGIFNVFNVPVDFSFKSESRLARNRKQIKNAIEGNKIIEKPKTLARDKDLAEETEPLKRCVQLCDGIDGQHAPV